VIRFGVSIAGLLLSGSVFAGSVLDYIRNYDLNDYAIGVAVSASQNPFVGGESSTFAYPYLTSFHDSSMTDDWLYFRGGGLGVRWVGKSGWEFGFGGRVQTLGFGGSDSAALIGVADRKWTIEVGPTIGWRGWPIHINLDLYAEVTDRHDGLVGELAFSWPLEYARGYIVPSVDISFQDSDYTDYYFTVSPAEATPGRPSYEPGAAKNIGVNVRWGYALSDKWLLAGSIGVEKLDTSITGSPIIDRDSIISGHIGVAYNVNVFQGREYDHAAPQSPRLEFKVAGFRDSISTKVTKDTVDGIPGFEIDIEDVLGVAEKKTVLQVDATARIGQYHRVELGYFELGRKTTTILENDLEFGDAFFPAGSEIFAQIDASVFRAVYAYSLMRDAQKELAIMVGAHIMNMDVEMASTTTSEAAHSKAGTPLPVIGVAASIFISDRTTIAAKVQIFRTDFEHYEGSLNYATLEAQYRVSEAVGIGLGYNFYGMKLSSTDSAVNGNLEIQHHGPVLFFTLGF
jgi:outer membrane protein